MPDSDPSSEATLLAENTDLANNTGDGGLPGPRCAHRTVSIELSLCRLSLEFGRSAPLSWRLCPHLT
jgi:hypothetical protein